MDAHVADALSDRLDELRLRFSEPIDLIALSDNDTVPVTLLHPHGRAEYRLGHSQSMTASSILHSRAPGPDRTRTLIVGPRVTERSASMLRREGIDYVDAAGNASITFEGVHIDVRGRRPPRNATTYLSGPRRGGVNLFSAKRAQVIFAILAWPHLLDGAVRGLATASGVSVGLAQQTIDLLEAYGFLGGGKRLSPHQRGRLTDQWAAAYPTGLGAPARTRPLSGDISSVRTAGARMFISGESAVPELLRPETLTLYADGLPTEVIRANRWRLNEESPNIFLRDTFWQSPDGPTGPGLHSAPWPLVYADLLASNDSRQAEAAQQLRESRA